MIKFEEICFNLKINMCNKFVSNPNTLLHLLNITEHTSNANYRQQRRSAKHFHYLTFAGTVY